ncbi:MAG: hypothetical protein Gaeavirus4_14 [Gaeavirus sp.]|uniref:Uncharacterized protein n=1 Tax=Gaeavirus sp. TaxID=2487767 RepID=A0A3G5A1D0_9VIRU|nr:MAG: hypothetical protein Gaeavirus4_14 [Gaeavirus sp.]
MQNNPDVSNMVTGLQQDCGPIVNKTCGKVSDFLYGAHNLKGGAIEQEVTFEVKPTNIIIESGDDVKLVSKYYNIFGYEMSLWTIILVSLVSITIMYFIYRWYFTSGSIVNIKKSKKNIKLKDIPNTETTNTTTNTNPNLNESITSSSDNSSSESK